VIFGNFKTPIPNEQWTTVPSKPIAGLRVACILIPNNTPTVAVRVCNISRRPIHLRKGQSVSVLQNVKLAAVPSAADVSDPTAEEQRRSVVDKVDPSVPDNIKQELLQLVEKYQDVFFLLR